MKRNPYLTEDRLQDVLAALQFLAVYPDYDLTEGDFRDSIAAEPTSAQRWGEVFADHPEFFRRSEHGEDYSLVLRRPKPKSDGLRPPLSSAELSMLIETAIHLQNHALELRRENRAWLPLALTALGIVAAFVGAVLGAYVGRTH
jgi:hypothetical protein